MREKKHPDRFKNADTTDPDFWRSHGHTDEDPLNKIGQSPAEFWQEENEDMETPQANDSSGEKEDTPQTFIAKVAKLPDGLFRSVLSRWGVAAASSVLTLVMAFVFRTPQAAFLLILAGWMLWEGLSIVFDYWNGEILETPLLCTSVQRGPKARNQTRVIFTDRGEIPNYYEFFIPGRKVYQFSPNYAYIIYTRRNNPRAMVGFQPL